MQQTVLRPIEAYDWPVGGHRSLAPLWYLSWQFVMTTPREAEQTFSTDVPLC